MRSLQFCSHIDKSCIEWYNMSTYEKSLFMEDENINMEMQYSVLMSVYAKERPDFLKAALCSMVRQTVRPAEIVLVCDGPLTDDLEAVLEEFGEKSTDRDISGCLHLVRLEKNAGLGAALSEGLKHCSCEWVARMDSDDIAAKDRCRRQLEYIEKHPEVCALSGTIAEFTGNAKTEEDAKNAVTSYKKVPGTWTEIKEYIKKRNPLNHPCVMFRKSSVLKAGSYQPCLLFEDYDLWVRMYLDGCIMANLDDVLLYMRVNEVHKRRGGISYAGNIVKFWGNMYKRGIISWPQYLTRAGVRVMVSLMPNVMRKIVYEKKLREH